MELNKKYIISNKPLKHILEEVQEFTDLIEMFKSEHKGYEYDIKIIKDGELFNGIITLTDEK